MSWVYIRSEPGLWTVGHYVGDDWHGDSDHTDREKAAARCNYLNGGQDDFERLSRAVGVLRDWLCEHTPGQDHSRLTADIELP